MKIQGPNHSSFNPYSKQVQKQSEIKNTAQKTDELQISSKAKELLENAKPEADRQVRVEKIKQAVENGEYKIEAEKTAKKMIDFWNNRP